jgi:hypothetical protein
LETQDEVADDSRLVRAEEESKTHQERPMDSSSKLPLLRPHPEQAPRASPCDHSDERPDKRLKKNVMDPEMRQQDLEADPILVIVTPKDVYCGICKRWIKLDARNDFYPGLWRKHRRTMHEIVSEAQWKSIRVERERKEEILEEKERQRFREQETTEREFKLGVKYKKDGVKSRPGRQETPQGLKSSTARSSPSSSGITRSCSRAST